MTRDDVFAARPSLAARALIALVRLYQLTLAWALGGHCRFTPSCSNYALACLRNAGALRGSWLTLRRLSRCHPFHPGGHDPPPPPRAPRAGTSGPEPDPAAPAPDAAGADELSA